MLLKDLLDPQVKAFYGDRLDKVPTEFAPPEEIRKKMNQNFNDLVHREEIFRWEDRAVVCEDRSIPVRIYWPGPEGSTPRPLILYFHGGGFVVHNIASHDDVCRRIANESDAIVISVEYRLAPEHPWPAFIDDGWEALLWLAENGRALGGDTDRICLMGDSAGASISASLSILTRDRKGPAIHRQVLIYGTYRPLMDSPSMENFSNGGFVLPRITMDWFTELTQPREFPMEQELHDQPETLVITAQCDPLKDDGEAFAAALKEAGNTVELWEVSGMMHGFILYWYVFDKANDLLKKVGETFR